MYTPNLTTCKILILIFFYSCAVVISSNLNEECLNTYKQINANANNKNKEIKENTKTQNNNIQISNPKLNIKKESIAERLNKIVDKFAADSKPYDSDYFSNLEKDINEEMKKITSHSEENHQEEEENKDEDSNATNLEYLIKKYKEQNNSKFLEEDKDDDDNEDYLEELLEKEYNVKDSENEDEDEEHKESAATNLSSLKNSLSEYTKDLDNDEDSDFLNSSKEYEAEMKELIHENSKVMEELSSIKQKMAIQKLEDANTRSKRTRQIEELKHLIENIEEHEKQGYSQDKALLGNVNTLELKNSPSNVSNESNIGSDLKPVEEYIHIMEEKNKESIIYSSF